MSKLLLLEVQGEKELPIEYKPRSLVNMILLDGRTEMEAPDIASLDHDKQVRCCRFLWDIE